MSNGTANLRADARRNYDRLISAGMASFEKQGATATLEGIAKRAGVGIGTLYRHFPTRRVLLEAVYADKISTLISEASSLLQKTSPDKALLAWLQTLVDYSTQQSGFSGLMELASKESDSPIALAGSTLLVKAQEAGLVRKDIAMTDLLRLMNGIVSDMSPEDSKRTDILVSVVVSGLKNPEPQKI